MRKYKTYEQIEDRVSTLFHMYGVPPSGQADNKAGEIVRALCRIRYRCYNDGDMINSGYGRETTNAAARFLKDAIRDDHTVRALINYLWGVPYTDDDYKEYCETVDDLSDAVITYLENHTELKEQKTQDFWDWSEPEDEYNEEEDW